MVSNEVVLLKLIKDNHSITDLLKRGLTYSQIAMLVEKLDEEKKIEILEEGLKLTSKGLESLNNNLKMLYPSKKDRWILPNDNLYNEIINKDVIILPSKNFFKDK